MRGGLLYVVDAGSKELIEYDLASGARRTIASDLPVGAPPGVTPKFLARDRQHVRADGSVRGASPPDADGTLYVSGDAEGSVLAIRQA